MIALSALAAVLLIGFFIQLGWPRTPTTSWYFSGGITERWFGSFWWHYIAGNVYFFAAIVFPIIALRQGGSPRGAIRWLFVDEHFVGPCHHLPAPLLGVCWLAILTLGLPLFIWIERLKFDSWVSSKPQPFRDYFTARFNLNSSNMETFWKAVAGFYVAAGLLSFSGWGEKNDAAPTQADVQALIKAVNSLEAAAKQPVQDSKGK